MSSAPSGARRGRPRDPSIDGRVLEATRGLLAERGFEATTVQAIAERSAVHPSAIYRRWPSRIEIIEGAVFPGLAPLMGRPTGDLRADLRGFIRAYSDALSEPAARAAAPGLLARARPAEQAESRQRLSASARSRFFDIVRAAPAEEIDPSVDLVDVCDCLLATVMARAIVPTFDRDRPVDRLVDMCARMLRPPTGRVPTAD